MEQNWLKHDGTDLVWCGTGWYLVLLGQYKLVLLGFKWYGALMPVYIDKSGYYVGCYHSGTNDEQKGKIELLSHLTMEG